MSRPAGRRNGDFDAKRAALARRAREELVVRGAGISMRELAEASGASLANLKHYFGDRDGLVEAITEECHREAAPYLAMASEPRGATAEECLQVYLDTFLMAWEQFGVGRLHEVVLKEGMGDSRKGPAFVMHLLEPSLQTAEKLLSTLMERGLLPPKDPRFAALSLLSPVLLGLLHQGGLGGNRCRPLDLRAFVGAHLKGWLEGWAT